MNLKDFNISISYTTAGEDAFSQIINPLLKCTKIYKRSVGYFSSSAFDFIADGVCEIAKNKDNGAHIYIATSPKLNEADIDAINRGYSEREIMQSAFIEEMRSALESMPDKNVDALYELVKNKVLDIKIIRKNRGMYHDKLALLEDWDGNVIACVGSNNETAPGYDANYEKIRVYKSWFDLEGRIADETDEFNSIWTNTNDSLQVYDFMDAFEKELIERVERDIKEKKKNKYEMRPYQKDAKKAWIKNGHKGFFVMATGTGKTVTALYSMQELITDNKILTVIAVPYKHLVNQWYEDVKEFFPDSYALCIHGEIANADRNLYALYKKAKKEYKPLIVITTIRSFFLERFIKIYNRIDFDKLLVVDEAHNFYNSMSPELADQYKFKLGLSATPVFGHNVEKTKTLLDWFGGTVIDLPIEKAIGKYLVNYDYHPYLITATEEDERKFAVATSLMLSGIDQKTHTIIDEDKFSRGYRGRLKAISMAENKLALIEDIFNKIEDTDHTIIYCSDGKLFFDSNESGGEVRHLEYVLKLINRAIIVKDPKLKASKFTATEDVNTRMKLIDSFDKGIINYLVAIRCLDEGINIPSITSALILSSNDNYRECVQRRGRILRKDGKKNKASIYDVIVLPSTNNRAFAEIEFRRFYEYSRIASNKDELLLQLNGLLDEYDLTIEDIKFNNDYEYGGDLDD